MERRQSHNESPAMRLSPGRPHLTVALGNPQRELALLTTLEEDFRLGVAVHAAEVLDRVRSAATDAVLLSVELPGFNPALATDLAHSPIGAHLLLLVSDPATAMWRTMDKAIVLPLGATPDEIRAALAALALVGMGTGRRTFRQSEAAEATTVPQRPLAIPDQPFTVLTVASGTGSPGRSTVALGLAAALGAVAPTVLVDADLAGPSLAALLDIDPRRNLFQIAYGQPEMPEEWDEELARALQPLGPHSPLGQVLCGLPTMAMRAGVTPAFFGRVIVALEARFRHVVLDLGADLLGADAALHRIGLKLAGQILLVTTPDLTDLLRARAALDALEGQLGIPPERVALIVNRHDHRRHQGYHALEWSLGRPLAALLPYDHAGAMRAKATRQSVVLDRRSKAGRALLELAGRVHGGAIMPPLKARRRPSSWLGGSGRARQGVRAIWRGTVADGD